jgi:hypothetical protein
MAKEKKEEPIVDNETGSLKVKEKQEVQPTGNETKGSVTKVKEKMTMKPVVEEQSVTKVSLDKPTEVEEDVTQEPTPQQVESVEPTKEGVPALEEVTNEDKTEEIVETVKEVVKESIEKGEPLPDGIQKLVSFMDETGGDINDFVKLNQDYSELDNQDLLREYYTQSKPHLNGEEINFLMEDQFSYDEDLDDEKEIKRKKLALKEQVANAKTQLEENKSKYYEDIKNGSKLTSEQQEAIDFFNRYSKEEAENKQSTEERISIFKEKTNNVFNDNFKGFEYNVGDKKYRYNVQDAEKIVEDQSSISNFIGKFLDENNTMQDAEGYHKSLFTANNADAIAKHFYEQGKSDAIKQSVERGKNISMEPRQAHGEVQAGGIKVRVLGDNTADFKFKIKNKNK